MPLPTPPAEIKVFSTHAMMEVLGALGPKFERASGHRLSCSYDPSNIIGRRIKDGAAVDVVIVTRPAMDEFARQRKVAADTCVDVGLSGLGVSVRKGAPKPEIGTVDAFRHALLAATSVARSAQGASGHYFETLLDRLGIAEAMRGRIKVGQSGRIAELVANGEAELAVQQISELLPVAGADYVGPLPQALQLYTRFSAGVATACTNPAAATAFVDLLAGPAAQPLLKANGLEPVR